MDQSTVKQQLTRLIKALNETTADDSEVIVNTHHDPNYDFVEYNKEVKPENYGKKYAEVMDKYDKVPTLEFGWHTRVKTFPPIYEGYLVPEHIDSIVFALNTAFVTFNTVRDMSAKNGIGNTFGYKPTIAISFYIPHESLSKMPA